MKNCIIINKSIHGSARWHNLTHIDQFSDLHNFNFRLHFALSTTLCSVIVWTGTSSPNLFFHFRFGRTWSEINSWRAFASTPRLCFLLLLLGRLSLLALSHLFRTCLFSLWSSSLSLYAPALIPLSLSKVRLCCCYDYHSFSPDGGTVRTAIQVHAVNLVELG